MPAVDLLGRHATLAIRDFATPGAWLAVEATPDADQLALPAAELPPGARVGDPIEVFVYNDSDDRPAATTRVPKLTIGQVTFLTVTDVTSIGAFVDWGLPKELLVPFAQQSHELQVGERHPFGLYVDRTGRLAATMFVNDLFVDRRRLAIDEWIEGEAWRNNPDIGLFVILEKAFVGLVPAAEPHSLGRGDTAKFRVTSLFDDGKIVLSLRQHAYQELAGDAAKVLAAISRPGSPPVGDRTDPETIRARFGLSKKAFKRAVGHLLKAGRVTIDPAGIVAPKG